MLYACHDLLPIHVVMEISWRKGLSDFTMPYFINVLAQASSDLAAVKKDNEERKLREKSQEKEENNAPILGGNRLMITAAPGMGGRQSPGFPQTNSFAPQATGYGGF